MQVSIVIPTFNRKDILLKCLRHLEQQTFPKKEFEVIVVDDGSTDNTKIAVKEFKKSSKLNMRYFFTEHVGPASVRNIGIEKALGKYIALINDDMIPAKNWLKEHMKIHKNKKNVAVLGFVDWDPEIEVNEFMRFIAPHGPLFDFRIKNWNNCGYKNFITANLTLESKWFVENKFNEEIKVPVCDDIELGIRLEKKGIRVIYDSKAIVYHCHVQTENSFFKRCFFNGKHLNLINKRFHEAFKPTVFDMLKLIFSRFYFLTFFNKKLYWKVKCGFFFYLGFFSEGYNKTALGNFIYLLAKLTYRFQESLEKLLKIDNPDILSVIRR